LKEITSVREEVEPEMELVITCGEPFRYRGEISPRPEPPFQEEDLVLAMEHVDTARQRLLRDDDETHSHSRKPRTRGYTKEGRIEPELGRNSGDVRRSPAKSLRSGRYHVWGNDGGRSDTRTHLC